MQIIRLHNGLTVLGANTAMYLMLRKARREAAKIRLVRMKARKDSEGVSPITGRTKGNAGYMDPPIRAWNILGILPWGLF
jgi:hypothetical protein